MDANIFISSILFKTSRFFGVDCSTLCTLNQRNYPLSIKALLHKALKVKRKEETNLIYRPSWLHWVSKCHNLNRPQWSELIAHSSNSGFIGWFPYNASAEYLIVSGIWHKDFSPLLIQIWFRKPPSPFFFFSFFFAMRFQMNYVFVFKWTTRGE